MATTGEPFGLFWDSENGDRTYSAASFEYWLKKFFTSGVFNGDLQVLASSGMTLEIQPGYANADGKVKFWNGAFNLTLNAANSTYPRIDTIVITRDNVNRQIVCEVVTGSYSGDVPQPTAPVRNSEIYQLVLAQIYVGAGVTGITQSNITDTRPNNELCGYITGTVEELDFSAFTAQFEAYFAEFKSNKETDYASWFNAVQQQQIQDKAAWDAWYAALQEELHNLPEDSAEYLQIQIDELKESGLSGSIFKITTINASLEGKTVTISNADNTEVRTATFDENLECMIYGFKSVGQITITSTDGIQTATSVVTIPYFGNYTFPIAFWAATVNIQGDTNLYGATITVKDSDDLTVGTVTLSAIDGTGTFTATKADTYSFNYTYQGTTYSQELVVSEETTYALSLSAGFSWTVWVDTASQLDSTDYASLSEVLADEEAVRELFLEHACVDYMAEATSSNADLETIIENDLCAKWINNSDYALDFLGANVAIKALMDTADKYGYGEWVVVDDTTTPPTYGPKGNVPVMTANNAPYGEVSATSVQSGSAVHYPFMDELDEHFWMASGANTGSGDALTYKFTNPVKCKKLKIKLRTNEASANNVTTKVQASNDGTNWRDVSESFTLSVATVSALTEVAINADNYYLYYKIVKVSSSLSLKFGITIAQFYGRSLSVSVPTMTSNTAPFGEAIFSSIYSTNFMGYYAFDDNDTTNWACASAANGWIGYHFNTNTKVLKARLKSLYAESNRNVVCKIQRSSTGNENDWHDVGEPLTLTHQNYVVMDVPSDADSPYWRLYQTRLDGESGTFNIATLQFYGLDYSEKEFEVGTTKKWLYDHGVELETFENLGSGAIVREDSQIGYNKTASGTYGIKTVSSLNFTNYSLIRAKVGNEITAANNEIALTGFSVYKIFASSDMPNNYGLDVTAVNESKEVLITPNAASALGKFFISELWLE